MRSLLRANPIEDEDDDEDENDFCSDASGRGEIRAKAARPT
jgi:hypothetical protein